MHRGTRSRRGQSVLAAKLAAPGPGARFLGRTPARVEAAAGGLGGDGESVAGVGAGGRRPSGAGEGWRGGVDRDPTL